MSEKMTLAGAKAIAMDARTESLRIALGLAAKASDEASSTSFAMASESGRGWDPDAHLMPIAEAILAAEERGRRRGVEERDAAKAVEDETLWGLVRQARHWMRADAPSWIKAKIDAALAPRDSGPVCNNCKRAQKASDGRTEASIEIGPCYCDRLRAPRDSGKEP